LNYEDLKSYEAETAVIGAALMRGKEIFGEPNVARLLPDYFTDDRTRDTWEEILRQNSTNFDAITIGASLQSVSGHVDGYWLAECIEHCGNAYFAAQYASVVWNLARKRRVYNIISNLGAALFKKTFDQVLTDSILSLQRVEAAK